MHDFMQVFLHIVKIESLWQINVRSVFIISNIHHFQFELVIQESFVFCI